MPAGLASTGTAGRPAGRDGGDGRTVGTPWTRGEPVRVIPLAPGDAALLAIAVRRTLAAFDTVPNLPTSTRAAVDDLRRLASRLEDAAKCGQRVLLCGEQCETEPRNFRVSQAAVVAHVSERSLRRRLATGELPSTRDGRGYLIPVEALVEWIQAGRPSGQRGAA